MIASICLLPPTLLMGATLPAIARWVESTPEGVSWLGFFYGGNIAGAVVGSILTGFYLLRVFDSSVATYVAVSLNVIVALVGLAIAKATPYEAVESAPSGVTRAADSTSVYVVIALSGMTALAAEVIWTRLLTLLFGGTTYTFSLILAVFLFGLGIGSSAGSAVAPRLARPRVALGWCQMLLCACMAWAAYTLSQSLPVLAAQSVGDGQPVDQPADRRRAIAVRHAAGGDPLGRELSAGAGLGRLARPGSGASGRRRLRRQHGRRDRRLAWREPLPRRAGSAPSTLSRC